MKDPVITYYAVYRSRDQRSANLGYESVCVALFDNITQALNEAGSCLREGYHAHIERGSMSASEFDNLGEVPDDFMTSFHESEVQP